MRLQQAQLTFKQNQKLIKYRGHEYYGKDKIERDFIKDTNEIQDMYDTEKASLATWRDTEKVMAMHIKDETARSQAISRCDNIYRDRIDIMEEQYEMFESAVEFNYIAQRMVEDFNHGFTLSQKEQDYLFKEGDD